MATILLKARTAAALKLDYQTCQSPTKVIHLEKVALTDDETDELAGHLLDDKAYDVLIEGNADVYKPDGSILCKLRHNVLDEATCYKAYPVWREAARDSHNRGHASGIIQAETYQGVNLQRGGKIVSQTRARAILPDGRVSNTMVAKTVKSGIVGYFDRSARFPYCRLTGYNLNRGHRFQAVMPFIQRVDAEFRDLMPDRYDHQLDYVRKTNPDFYIHGTSFTTITVNRNFQTAVHKDVGDLKEGFGVMSCLRHGRFDGCYFCFPKYRVALDMRTGSVLTADVHEWHGNTTIRGNKGLYERVSMVFYYREKMTDCGSAYDELERAKHAPRKQLGGKA